MNYDFSKKTVLITGATRGIGKAIADALITCGANLILTGTKQNEIINLNKTFIDNPKINYLHLDFLNDKSKKIFYTNISKVKKIDVCINNAGVNYVEDFIKSSKFDEISKVNIQGPYELLKMVTPKMINHNYGRIINIASIWSVSTKKGRSLYTMSKSALVGLTKTLSIELASYNILVNAVSPGFTLTELTKNTNTPKELEEIKASIPIKRLAMPNEIANLVRYLCSTENTYLTGQNIIIDGGFTNL